MRVITVDNGNSNPHVGIFQNDLLQNVIPLKDYSPLTDDFILISDVGVPLNFKPSFDLKSKHQNNLFFDMPINYSQTLGDDRLIIAYSIFKQMTSPEKTLVIDAGTFITMDLISKDGFAGGFIFPGLTAFLSSYQRGSKLPVLEMNSNYELKDIAHSTPDAILGAAEIYLDSVLAAVIKKTSPSKIIITGGSLELVKNKIEKLSLPKVQLETYPHLIHSSLYEIFRLHLRSIKS